MQSKFIRPKKDRVIAGVCNGLANYFKIDVVIVRLIFVLMIIAEGAGALIYLILLIIMPEEDGRSYADQFKKEVTEENKEKVKSEAIRAMEKTKMAVKNSKGEIIFAYAIIIIGLLFLVNNLFPSLSFNRSWPLLLILLGILILLPVGGKEKDERK